MCIKVLRVYDANTYSQKEPMAVRDARELLVRSNVADTLQGFIWRSRCLEETATCKCCTFLGCYNVGAVTACVGVDA